jgi:hypothetical protein
MDINVIERVIPFPRASVRVPGLQTRVKMSWELNQGVQTVTRDSEKLLIFLYLPLPSNSMFLFYALEAN